MGRYLLCGKEARQPLELEDLDLRIYTIEELCWYIYHDLDLISDDFIDERLIRFIETELELQEIAEKIRRFHSSSIDFDATVRMLLAEVGYYDEAELKDFQERVISRRRTSSPQRLLQKAVNLQKKGRLAAAVRVYRTLLHGPRDGRMSTGFYMEAYENLADCYGKLFRFEKSLETLKLVYDETRSERILKKMYDICILSGIERDDLFARVDPDKLSRWQSDYWNREVIARSKVDESPAMQIFLQAPDTARNELRQLVDSMKEEYRSMLQ